MRLTAKMNKVLLEADLGMGEISNVPLSTLAGLERRGLVNGDWRKPINTMVSTTAGNFPSFGKIKLTAAGSILATSLQRHPRG